MKRRATTESREFSEMKTRCKDYFIPGMWTSQKFLSQLFQGTTKFQFEEVKCNDRIQRVLRDKNAMEKPLHSGRCTPQRPFDRCCPATKEFQFDEVKCNKELRFKNHFTERDTVYKGSLTNCLAWGKSFISMKESATSKSRELSAIRTGCKNHFSQGWAFRKASGCALNGSGHCHVTE
jgi:hypothetical protein